MKKTGEKYKSCSHYPVCRSICLTHIGWVSVQSFMNDESLVIGWLNCVSCGWFNEEKAK